jgi:DNA ligase-1
MVASPWGAPKKRKKKAKASKPKPKKKATKKKAAKKKASRKKAPAKKKAARKAPARKKATKKKAKKKTSRKKASRKTASSSPFYCSKCEKTYPSWPEGSLPLMWMGDGRMGGECAKCIKSKKASKKTPARKKATKKASRKKKKTPRRSSSRRPSGGPGPKPGPGYGVWCKICQEFVGDEYGEYCQEHPGEWNIEWKKGHGAARTSSGIVVECVREGGKIRVRPAAGQGYDYLKNIQFPRALRFEGCKYTVDALDDKGSHYRAVGEIVPFEGGVGAPAPASRPTPRRKKSKKPALPKIPGKGKGPRAVLLAHKWKPSCDPRGWWISEKLDGLRAYWDGAQFYSRAGNPFYAPAWFTKGLPKEPLDGELWIGRGMFQQTMSVVRSQGMSDAWKRVRYLVFDAPAHPGGFEERLEAVKKLVKGAPYAKAIRHYRCKGEGHMVNELEAIESRGGEGLMLRAPGSMYEGRRSRTLLKVKTFHDAEARITGYYPGKGRHKGVIGGFYVTTLAGAAGGPRAGVQFKIGTGLSDAERADPPPVGSVITYRYQELSDSGTPRFASYVRVRKNPYFAPPALSYTSWPGVFHA